MENWKATLYPIYHRSMWNWLAENPHEYKSMWPNWKYIAPTHSIRSDCFACEYASIKQKEFDKNNFDKNNSAHICDFCPCSNIIQPCGDRNSIFDTWDKLHKYTTYHPLLIKKMAIIIRDSWK